jgi:hypothetical protein
MHSNLVNPDPLYPHPQGRQPDKKKAPNIFLLLLMGPQSTVTHNSKEFTASQVRPPNASRS